MLAILEELRARVLAGRSEQQRVDVVDVQRSGASAHVRIEPSPATQHVVLRQQATLPYNRAGVGVEVALSFVATRIRDVVLDTANGRYLWAVPVFRPRTGGEQRFDGTGGAQDLARRVDLGA